MHARQIPEGSLLRVLLFNEMDAWAQDTGALP